MNWLTPPTAISTVLFSGLPVPEEVGAALPHAAIRNAASAPKANLFISGETSGLLRDRALPRGRRFPAYQRSFEPRHTDLDHDDQHSEHEHPRIDLVGMEVP